MRVVRKSDLGDNCFEGEPVDFSKETLQRRKT